MNQKFIVKIEQGNLEQSYKIAESDVLNGVNGVFEILDDQFITQVLNTFAAMRSGFNQAYNRYY